MERAQTAAWLAHPGLTPDTPVGKPETASQHDRRAPGGPHTDLRARGEAGAADRGQRGSRAWAGEQALPVVAVATGAPAQPGAGPAFGATRPSSTANGVALSGPADPEAATIPLLAPPPPSPRIATTATLLRMALQRAWAATDVLGSETPGAPSGGASASDGGMQIHLAQGEGGWLVWLGIPASADAHGDVTERHHVLAAQIQQVLSAQGKSLAQLVVNGRTAWRRHGGFPTAERGASAVAADPSDRAADAVNPFHGASRLPPFIDQKT
ncbi:MAG: hypothetical protein REJ50_14115 [Bordetella sp.]|nr:hypothetical protein [Bordetella sp.]